MTPEEAKEFLETQMEEDLKVMTAKERQALYWGQVLEFFQPKRQRTSINQNDSELPDDLYNEQGLPLSNE